MQFFQLRALAALVTSVAVLLAGPARQAARRLIRPQSHHPRPRLPADYAQWSRVAGCESGGWRVIGDVYPDSLGISRENFIAFGGKPLPPGGVSLANRIMQIQVADRLIARYHMGIPDAYGCAAW